jgi:hypothetical protein
MSKDVFHSEKYTLPVIASLRVQREWRVSSSRGDNPEFTFQRENRLEYHWVDAFEVRSEFLAIQSPGDALRLFQNYGPFQLANDMEQEGKKHRTAHAQAVTWSAIQKAQKEFEEALVADSIPQRKAWLYDFVFGRPIVLEWSFRSMVPRSASGHRYTAEGMDDAAVAECDDIVDALRVSIFLSRKSGFGWSRCVRKGCNQVFERTTRRQKLYCSPECAHLQAVNNYNARENTRRRSAKQNRRRKADGSLPTKGK